MEEIETDMSSAILFRDPEAENPCLAGTVLGHSTDTVPGEFIILNRNQECPGIEY
jgi:hypothetical protein